MYNEAELLWRQMSPSDWQTSMILDAFEDYVNGAIYQWSRVQDHLNRDRDLRDKEKEDIGGVHSLVEAAYEEMKKNQELMARDWEDVRAIQELAPRTYEDLRQVEAVLERAQEDMNKIQELMARTRQEMRGIQESSMSTRNERSDLTTLIFLDISFYLTCLHKAQLLLGRLAENSSETSLGRLYQDLQPRFKPFEEALRHLEESEVRSEDRLLEGAGDIVIDGNCCTYAFEGEKIDLGQGLSLVKEAYEGVISEMRSRLQSP